MTAVALFIRDNLRVNSRTTLAARPSPVKTVVDINRLEEETALLLRVRDARDEDAFDALFARLSGKMTVAHHPDLAWLVDYTTGALTPGFRAVVGGHLRQCAHCQSELRLTERVGADLVAAPAAHPVTRLTPAAIRARAGTAHYAAGDVDENDAKSTHQPIVTADGDCVSLLVFEGPLQYKGALGVAQKILRF